MTIEEIITKALNEKKYRSKLLASLVSNDINFESSVVCSDNKISEELFLLFIERCKKDKKLIAIFEAIDYWLIVEKNITDAVFAALIELAQKRKKHAFWIYLDLCHEARKPEHMEYLRSLDFLNESCFY